jgi:OOP family OmpA-OmpF porin
MIAKYIKSIMSIKSMTLGCVMWGVLWGVGHGQGRGEVGPGVLETRQGGVNSRIEVLGAVFEGLPAAVDGSQVRLVFYRLAGGQLGGATGVFVNEEYHTSLVPGGWSDLCHGPGALELGARQMRVDERARDALDSISQVSVQGGQVQYFRVVERGGRPVLEPVGAQLAQEQMRGLRYQQHTISRVDGARRCVAQAQVAVAPAPAAAAVRQVTLAADALFAFGRSDLGAMTAQGRRALDQLLERLRGEYVRMDSLRIVGHADPIGSVAHNEQLAARRAQTVREYVLQSALVGTAQVLSEGRGSREPVVSCALQASASAIACHQPNRRVVIEVAGVMR